MVRVDSTKGATFEKFVVMACDGKDVLDTALTLQEATTKLADMSQQDACFVLKILRTSDDADPSKAFRVRERQGRMVEVPVATPPHVVTVHEPDDEEEPDDKPARVRGRPPKKAASKTPVEKKKERARRKAKASEDEDEEHRVPPEI